MYSQDVVDVANSHTLSEEGKFVQCSNEVCFAQELVCDVLSRSDSDSERDASSGNCGNFGHVLHVTVPPLKRRCVQVVHVVDDFCFLVFRSAPTLALATSNSCKKDGTKIGCHILVCQASVRLQRMLRVVGTGKIFRATKLEVG